MALALAADGNTYLPKGSYAVTVSLGGQESKQVLLLE
jgi:phage gp45-like